MHSTVGTTGKQAEYRRKAGTHTHTKYTHHEHEPSNLKLKRSSTQHSCCERRGGHARTRRAETDAQTARTVENQRASVLKSEEAPYLKKKIRSLLAL